MVRGFAPELLVPSVFPHEVEHLELIETHISWIVLTGTVAYKFKKPVDFGFVDFSSLEKRRHACEEELRLNRRSAPTIYLGLVALVERDSGLALADAEDLRDFEPVIDYGVKMHEFPQSAQLDRQFREGLLTSGDMDEIAATVAALHEAASVAEAGQPWGEPDAVAAPARENFRHLRELAASDEDLRILDGIAQWSENEFSARRDLFRQRKQGGRVRECHGDLHLTNLVRLDGSILAFDCIEFNPALRWIDVLSDAAFLHMDLAVRRRTDLAFRFINAYLECCGDYPGVGVLPFYLAYRSMVRAKVATLQLQDPKIIRGERETLERRRRRHLEFAQSLTVARRPRLLLMYGFSGSGKTWLSERLMEHLPALRIRSDVERKRLHGLRADADSRSGPGSGIYTESASRRTYKRLIDCADAMLGAGFDVVVDAAFLEDWQRRPFAELAARRGLASVVIACNAPPATLRQRLRERHAAGSDASEADLGILAQQIERAETDSVDETGTVVRVDTSREIDIDSIRRRLPP